MPNHRHISPFRYPGGKAWLVDEMLRRLVRVRLPDRFVEPFAGGATIGLSVARVFNIPDVVLIERDPDVAAVWQCILGDDATTLMDMIKDFDCTAEHARAVLDTVPKTNTEHAFRTIVQNRVCYGSAITAEAGLLKDVACRWYPKTIVKRIEAIWSMRDRIGFLHQDGMAYLKKHARSRHTCYYIDPPYSQYGRKRQRRLYNFDHIDAGELLSICSALKGSFWLSYDNSEGIRSLAEGHDFHVVELRTKNVSNVIKTELLITNHPDPFDA